MPMVDVRTAAMEVVLAWGPERAVPQRERLRSMHPVCDEVLGEALDEAQRVLSQAEEMAGDMRKNAISNPTDRLMEGRPWLTVDQADRAIQQGLYLYWREKERSPIVEGWD